MRAELVLLLVPFAKLLLHMLTASGYGYFRDEFYYMVCSEHLAFGYVDHPPFSIFLLRIQRWILGDSLLALRFLPAVAGALTVYVAGRMAREAGGGPWAQFLAMIAVLAAPEFLALNHFYSMNSFDLLFWSLGVYQILRVLRSPTQQGWILLGVILGLGLMNKISVLWLGAGLFVGLLLTDHRRMFRTSGPWIAGAIAGAIFLPYILWQAQNDWATLEFMRNATTQKMAGQDAMGFFQDQIDNMHPLSFPLWLTGLLFGLFNRGDSRLRLTGWIYVTVTAILLASPASRSGYLAPAYPMLFALGAVAFERVFQRRLRLVIPAYPAVLAVTGGFLMPFAVPILPVESYVSYARRMGVEPSTEEKKELGDLPQFYADMFGWPEITEQVARVYLSLPEEERRDCRIFGNNYGHTGAVTFFGKQYGLPPAISSHNNYWIWGPGDFNGKVLIIIGGGKESKQRLFEDVQEAGKTSCGHCMPYENNATIYVCRRMKDPVNEVWNRIKHYD